MVFGIYREKKTNISPARRVRFRAGPEGPGRTTRSLTGPRYIGNGSTVSTSPTGKIRTPPSTGSTATGLSRRFCCCHRRGSCSWPGAERRRVEAGRADAGGPGDVAVVVRIDFHKKKPPPKRGLFPRKLSSPSWNLHSGHKKRAPKGPFSLAL